MAMTTVGMKREKHECLEREICRISVLCRTEMLNYWILFLEYFVHERELYNPHNKVIFKNSKVIIKL